MKVNFILIAILSLSHFYKILTHYLNAFEIIFKINEITLKIKGKEIQNIIYPTFSGGFPDEIICNETYNNKQCKFINEENIVIMRWNKQLTDCGNMFYNCKNIIEIDLSKFDTSKVIEMRWMFDNCESLIYIKLDNLDTSQVTQMNSMFFGCSKLTSIDLSNLNSDNVLFRINSMFKNCVSLRYINFTNFDSSHINRMDELFSGCTSLESIDLSSLSFSSITNLDNMFDSCNNLKYINLKNANKQTGFTINNIFNGIPINIVFCFEEQNVPLLYRTIKTKICAIHYCSDNWKEVQLKIIDGRNNCVNNCGNYTSTLYELDNKCYFTCPSSYISRPDINKCLCQIENCSLCSAESLQNNLCISCNNYDCYYQFQILLFHL